MYMAERQAPHLLYEKNKRCGVDNTSTFAIMVAGPWVELHIGWVSPQ
jgi:hypothetical protein